MVKPVRYMKESTCMYIVLNCFEDDADAKQGNGASTNHSDQKGDKDKKDLHKSDANWTVFCTNFTEAPVGRTRQASVGLFVDWVNAFHFLNSK